MPDIIVSYRKEDSQATGRLIDYLEDNIANTKIKEGVQSLYTSGDNLSIAVYKAVNTCDALLVMIGPKWLEDEEWITDPNNPDRVVIATAIKESRRIIPILIDGATLPQSDSLPEDIADLTLFVGIDLNNETFHEDAEVFLKVFHSTHVPPRVRKKRQLMAAAAMACVGLFALYLLFLAKPLNDTFGPQKLMFSVRDNNRNRIYIINEDGTKRLTLFSWKTRGQAQWSSNGRSVFLCEGAGDDCDLVRISIIDLPNSLYPASENTLPRGRSLSHLPSNAISSDGKYIILDDFDDTEVYSITEKRIVHTLSEWWLSDYSWSPDGERIVYEVKDDDDNYDVFIFSLATGEDSRLINNAYDPVWSPTGEHIAYYDRVHRGPGTYLNVINSDGSNPTNISQNPNNSNMRILRYEWSPDGKFIAYIQALWNKEGNEQLNSQLSISNIITGEKQLIDIGLDSPDFVQWSPDGTILTYYDSNVQQLLLLDLQTMTQKPVPLKIDQDIETVGWHFSETNIFQTDVVWSWDSTKLAIITTSESEDDEGEQRNLYIVDIKTGKKDWIISNVEYISINGWRP